MAVIQGQVNLAAGGVNDNLLAGSQYEFIGSIPQIVEFAITGATGANVVIDCYSGADVIAENMRVKPTNAYPTYPDDYIGQDVAAPGDRMKIRARNQGGAAIEVFYTVKMTPFMG
jgi:hypothetical protein